MLRCLWQTVLVIVLLGLPLSVFGSVNSVGARAFQTEAEFNRLWNKTLDLALVDSTSKDVVWATQIEQDVAAPFLAYWALDDLLSLLLGAHSEALREPLRSQVVSALSVTLKRYVFEVLLDYDVHQKTIKELEIHLTQEVPSIDARVQGPLGITVALRYLLINTNDQVFIRDMEVANIRYSNWKKSFYRKYAKKADWQGLVLALNKKNNRFFGQFCEDGDHKTTIPNYIETACIN